MTGRSGRVPLFIPALLIAAGAASTLSTDLYAPSLPHLPAVFGTDAATVQLTMSINLATFALAQLLHGPLADRFGRRPVFLIGLVFFCLTAIMAAVAWSIGALIAARGLMGVAAAVEAVIALAVIRDLYREADAVKVLAAYGMALAAAPALGPAIGGFVHVWLGWRANFYILAAFIACVTVLTALSLPETLGLRDRMSLRPGRLLRGYGALLANRGFMSYSLATALNVAGLFAFITAAPFIFIDRLGVPTQHYGLFQAFIVAAYFVGSMAANRAVGRYSERTLYGAGVLTALAGGVLLMVMVAVVEAPWPLAGAMGVFAAGLGLIFAAGPVLAFASARDAGGGISAALLGSLELSGGAIGALAVGWFHNGTAWPMAIVVAGGAAAALLFWLVIAPTPARSVPS